MRRTRRYLTLLLAAFALCWAVLPLLPRGTTPTPVDTEAPPTPETSPFSLLLVFTDGDTPSGILVLEVSAQKVHLTGIPVHARLMNSDRFVNAGDLANPLNITALCRAVERQLKISIDNSVIWDYDSFSACVQQQFGNVTLTLPQAVAIPFIGDRLILPAGRQTLTPPQLVAYWRASAEPLTTVTRQGETLAILLSAWLTSAYQSRWDAAFAQLADTAVTDWRIDRYTVYRRTLTAFSACDPPLPVTFSLPRGSEVGQENARRFEFED